MTEDNAATGDTLRWTHRINLCFRSPIVTPISSNGAINTILEAMNLVPPPDTIKS